MNPNPDSPLLSDKLGGFTGAHFFWMMAGVILLGVQVLMLASPLDEQPKSILMVAPGIVGAVWIILQVYWGLKKGHVSVYLDRIEGKRATGKSFSFPLSELALPALRSSRLTFQNQEGRVLLNERPGKQAVTGLVWLLKTYTEWPLEVWSATPAAEGHSPASRQFMDPEGNPFAADQGFLLQMNAAQWYFPETNTLSHPGTATAATRYHQRPSISVEIPIQFDPSPRHLPLAFLCGHILASLLPPDLQLKLLDELAHNHGGHRCMPHEGYFTGECLGYAVEVYSKR